MENKITKPNEHFTCKQMQKVTRKKSQNQIKIKIKNQKLNMKNENET